MSLNGTRGVWQIDGSRSVVIEAESIEEARRLFAGGEVEWEDFQEDDSVLISICNCTTLSSRRSRRRKNKPKQTESDGIRKHPTQPRMPGDSPTFSGIRSECERGCHEQG